MTGGGCQCCLGAIADVATCARPEALSPVPGAWACVPSLLWASLTLSAPLVAPRPAGLRSVCLGAAGPAPRSEGPVLGPGLRVGGLFCAAAEEAGAGRDISEDDIVSPGWRRPRGRKNSDTELPWCPLKSQRLPAGTVAPRPECGLPPLWRQLDVSRWPGA